MKHFILAIIVLFSFSCSKKELLIEPIGEGIYNMGYRELQYYTISNYKHLSNDSLLNTLRDYVLKNTSTKITNQNFDALFYKKSVFAEYEYYIWDAIRSEMGGIDEHRDNLIAKIYYLKKERDKYPKLISVLYYEDFVLPFQTVYSKSIALLKIDTLVKDSDKNLIYENGNFNTTME